MIRFDTSTGQVELFIERHRPTYCSPELLIIRSLDSSTVCRNAVVEDEYYFRSQIDASTLSKSGQYVYKIVNPSTGKVYETGLIYSGQKTENQDIIYGK